MCVASWSRSPPGRSGGAHKEVPPAASLDQEEENLQQNSLLAVPRLTRKRRAVKRNRPEKRIELDMRMEYN